MSAVIDREHFRYTTLTPAFGAEVHGLDPSAKLSPGAASELRALFDRFGVLVFRDLALERTYQQYLALLVNGDDDLSNERIATTSAEQSSFYISNQMEQAAAPYGVLLFHSDGMWSDAPFHVISLWGEDVAPPVPPTLFASTTKPLASLPADLRTRLAGLEAVHVPGPGSFSHRKLEGVDGGRLVMPKREKEHSIVRPVISRHPRTGVEFICVNQQMTSHIVGMAPDDSEALLDELFSHLYAADNTLAHEWRENDLVLWDNLSTQHARPDVERGAAVRTLRKVGWPMPDNAHDQNILDYEQIEES